MSRSQLYYALLLTLLALSKGIAQDTLVKKVDSLYREDQFYLGITYNFLSAVPDDVSIRGLSGGLHFGYFRDMPVNKRRNVAVAVGAGLAFDRFGQTLFIGELESEETLFTVLNDDIDFDTNRLSLATVEVPVEFRWRTSTPEIYKFWRIHAGFRVGYTYWYRSTFKQPGNEVIQTDIPQFQRIRLGATLSFGYNTFNFYGYYNLAPFFKDAVTTDGEPFDLSTIKIGLMFYIL
ncbi:MAG: PorT family protein [Altibacter sp.]|nr:PorT family protein [Altibacter sp.]